MYDKINQILIQPRPVLIRLDTYNIYRFLTESKRYLRSNSLTLTELVDHRLLECIVDLKTIHNVNCVEDINDENLKEWLEEKVSNTFNMKKQKAVIFTLRNEVSINMREPNVELRILQLFTDYYRFMRNIGWEDFVHQAPKQAARHIYMLLEPVELKTEVMEFVEDTKVSATDKFDWPDFCKKVRYMASEQALKWYFLKGVDQLRNEA